MSESPQIDESVINDQPISTPERQKNVLDRLEVGKVEDVFTQDEILKPYLREYRIRPDFIGTENINLGSDRKLRLSGTENGIFILQVLKETEEKISGAPRGSSLLSVADYRQYPISIAEVERYVIVDRTSGMACDISQTWRNQNEKEKPRVVKIPLISRSMVYPVKEGIVANLSDLSKRNDITGTLDGIPDNLLPLVELMTDLHEIGHTLQTEVLEKQSTRTFTQALEGEAAIYHSKRIIQDIGKFFSRTFNIKNTENPETRPLGKLVKYSEGNTERNAHAFAISVARLLRSHGLDVFKGAGASLIKQSILNSLGSHQNAHDDRNYDPRKEFQETISETRSNKQ